MVSLYIPNYRSLNVTYATSNEPSGQATVHYVEAGNPRLPTMLLLHGYPSSSYEYRDLIPLLSDQYHVLAPDIPGFGLTNVSDSFIFTFANLAIVVGSWLAALGVKETIIYIHDYGAPVGLRLAITNIIKPLAIVTQNGNFFEAGFGQEFWAPIFELWNTSNSAAAQKVVAENVLTFEGTKYQYVTGTPPEDLELVDPGAWHFNYLQNLAGTVNKQRQLDLFYDYRTNVQLYPQFQKYVQDNNVPVLAVWGKNDPAFVPAGAEAIRNSICNAVVEFVDAGHFAVESKRWQIARIMKEFLASI